MTETAKQDLSYRESLSQVMPEKWGNAPSWLGERRENALRRFKQFGFPTKKHEAWRNVHLEGLLTKPFRPAISKRAAAPADVLLPGMTGVEWSGKVCLQNGIVTAIECPKPSESFSITKISEALKTFPERMKSLLASRVDTAINPFDLINTFSFSEGIYIRVAKGVKLERAIILVNEGGCRTGERPVSYPRILVDLEEGAEAVILHFQTSANDESYFLNLTTEVSLAPRAKLFWMNADLGGAQANRHARFDWHLAAESDLKTVSFFSGGELTYEDHALRLEGEGANYELAGLSVLTGKSHVNNFITATHSASHVTGRQFFKNLLAGESQGEFNSMVHVCAGTLGSDSDQLNRNLILSESARSFSRPQLKIDSDEVKATHGSATGQLNPQEVFYLQSRGLSRDEARYLLACGFVNEVLAKIPIVTVREGLEKFAHEELRKMI